MVPGDLKTPRELAQSKSSSALVSVNPGPSNAALGTEGSTKLNDPITSESSTLKKRRNPDDVDTPRPAPLLRHIDETQAKPPNPRPSLLKKRAKEVSMFIPKKRPDLKVILTHSLSIDFTDWPNSE